ncbi:MAG: hypothetical protein WC988_02775 [Patescibacteria group bacterium]
MYHGVLIDQEFTDTAFPKSFKMFAEKQDGSWKIFGVEIEDSRLEESIKTIQQNIKTDSAWYAHLYNDKILIVIFKDKVFYVKPHADTWKPIINYGKELRIPEEQLDFWPNRFQDEHHYFTE